MCRDGIPTPPLTGLPHRSGPHVSSQKLTVIIPLPSYTDRFVKLVMHMKLVGCPVLNQWLSDLAKS